MSRRRHDVNVLDKPLAKFERRLPALALPVRDSTPKEGALIPRRQGRLLSRSGLPEERVDQRRPAARATAIRAAFHEDRVLDPSQEGFDLVRG